MVMYEGPRWRKTAKWRAMAKQKPKTNLERDLEKQRIDRALYVVTEIEVRHSRMTRPQAFCLGMVVEHLFESGQDSSFAQTLIRLITGEL